MEIIKKFYKSFKTHEVIFRFSQAELSAAKFTAEENATLRSQEDTYEIRLTRALIIARAIERTKAGKK